MSYYEIPERWVVPGHIWQQSFDEMALDGHLGREGVAMWLGTYEGSTARVERTVILRGASVIKTFNQLVIGADVMNAVTDLAISLELSFVGQIHSHSPVSGTDLSYPDRHMGIVAPGYLSLVAPDFALRPHTSLADCGVHVHEGATGWRRLRLDEIESRFTMPIAPALPPVTAEA